MIEIGDNLRDVLVTIVVVAGMVGFFWVLIWGTRR